MKWERMGWDGEGWGETGRDGMDKVGQTVSLYLRVGGSPYPPAGIGLNMFTPTSLFFYSPELQKLQKSFKILFLNHFTFAREDSTLCITKIAKNSLKILFLNPITTFCIFPLVSHYFPLVSH
jgi:hypothetical protein